MIHFQVHISSSVLFIHFTLFFIFFFNDTATTEIYTLSLHDALPICRSVWRRELARRRRRRRHRARIPCPDRKSTRLNSSHVSISYAVFCLKKKKKTKQMSKNQMNQNPLFFLICVHKRDFVRIIVKCL